jgi:hypothetical protein
MSLRSLAAPKRNAAKNSPEFACEDGEKDEGALLAVA